MYVYQNNSFVPAIRSVVLSGVILCKKNISSCCSVRAVVIRHTCILTSDDMQLSSLILKTELFDIAYSEREHSA